MADLVGIAAFNQIIVNCGSSCPADGLGCLLVDTAKVQVPLWECDHDIGFSEGCVDLRVQVVDDQQSTVDFVEKCSDNKIQ